MLDDGVVTVEEFVIGIKVVVCVLVDELFSHKSLKTFRISFEKLS